MYNLKLTGFIATDEDWRHEEDVTNSPIPRIYNYLLKKYKIREELLKKSCTSELNDSAIELLIKFFLVRGNETTLFSRIIECMLPNFSVGLLNYMYIEIISF